VFRRIDLGGVSLKASWRNTVEQPLCTRLDDGRGVSVATVEHLMAAFAGLEIDNVVVELDGPEVPVMDGSAAPFVFLVECAGVVEQEAPRRAIKVLKSVSVGEGGKFASLAPDDSFSMSFAIDFASRAISRQDITIAIDPETFKSDISRARTFGFMRDVAKLWSAGYALGASLENTVVVAENRVLNAEGVRFPDEFVRHKAVDAVGDLQSQGARVLLVGDGIPQRDELRPVMRRRSGEDVVEVAHILGIGRAARDRVAAPDDAQPGAGQERQDPVRPAGIGIAPGIVAKVQVAALAVHVEAVVGAEHHHADVRVHVGLREPIAFRGLEVVHVGVRGRNADHLRGDVLPLVHDRDIERKR